MVKVVFEFRPAVSPFYWLSHSVRLLLVWGGAIATIVGIPAVLYAPSMQGPWQEDFRQSFAWWPYTASLVLFAIGLALSTRARYHLKQKCQWWEHSGGCGLGTNKQELTGIVSTGPYRYTRHPAYAAGLIFSIGAALGWHQVSHWSWSLAVLVLVSSVMCAWMEEIFLRHTFSQDYNKYRSKVGILPRPRTSSVQLSAC